MKHGDFTGLAGDYARFRPGYAPQVATAILGYVRCDVVRMDAADIGAGTGIWTRMLAANGLRSVVAVEPNDDMRRQGMETSPGTDLVWHKRFGGSYWIAGRLRRSGKHGFVFPLGRFRPGVRRVPPHPAAG